MDAIETSKTHRLYLLLKEQIATGVLASGERLPGEPRLASTHGLSRVTVRRALNGLARDGLIRRHPGAGTFVQKPRNETRLTGDLTNMLAYLMAMGRDTDVRLLSFRYGAPPASVAEALGLEHAALTQHALRVRSLNGEPFSYLSTHVPEAIGRSFSEVDLARVPLLTLLERSGIIVDQADQTIAATLAGPEAAAALDVEIGAPLLSLIRVVRDVTGRGVEYLSALYRPERHRFHMELSRAGEGTTRYWQTAQPKLARTATPPRRDAATDFKLTNRRRRP